MSKLDSIFNQIKTVLKGNSTGFREMDEYLGSKASVKKPAYHLYGKKEVSLFGKKPQLTYIAGVIKQKNYVSFYLSPVYSHPELLKGVNDELKAFLKGKSCFNLNRISPVLLDEIEKVLQIGIEKYREIGWI